MTLQPVARHMIITATSYWSIIGSFSLNISSILSTNVPCNSPWDWKAVDNMAYSILSCYQLLRSKPTGKRIPDLKSQGNSNNRYWIWNSKFFLKIRILLGVLIANYEGPITSNTSTVMTRSFRVLIVKSRLTSSRAEVRMSDNKTRQRSQLVDVIAGNQVLIQCAPDKD